MTEFTIYSIRTIDICFKLRDRLRKHSQYLHNESVDDSLEKSISKLICLQRNWKYFFPDVKSSQFHYFGVVLRLFVRCLTGLGRTLFVCHCSSKRGLLEKGCAEEAILKPLRLTSLNQ